MLSFRWTLTAECQKKSPRSSCEYWQRWNLRCKNLLLYDNQGWEKVQSELQSNCPRGKNLFAFEREIQSSRKRKIQRGSWSKFEGRSKCNALQWFALIFHPPWEYYKHRIAERDDIDIWRERIGGLEIAEIAKCMSCLTPNTANCSAESDGQLRTMGRRWKQTRKHLAKLKLQTLLIWFSYVGSHLFSGIYAMLLFALSVSFWIFPKISKDFWFVEENTPDSP